MNSQALKSALGNTDIYLIDAILKGYFDPCSRLLDAGCGEGRNLTWFLGQMDAIYGIDLNESALLYAKIYCRSLNKKVAEENFLKADLAQNPFPNDFFDAAISIAVLHFAQNREHFTQQWNELVRVCRPGGLLFLRLSTLMGMDYIPEPVENDWFLLKSSDIWYLPDQKQLEELIQANRLQLLEPMKSVCVHGQRSMSTLILRKPA